MSEVQSCCGGLESRTVKLLPAFTLIGGTDDTQDFASALNAKLFKSTPANYANGVHTCFQVITSQCLVLFALLLPSPGDFSGMIIF